MDWDKIIKITEIIRKSRIEKIKKAICAYLYAEYKKYDGIVIAKPGGKSCEFKEMIKLECTPGFVPSFECVEFVEITKPMAEKAAEILKIALSLGCDWAKEEAEKLGIETKDTRKAKE
ncbi:MAG: hypothetical protein ABIL02_03500 [candidate division WOR-3 bacterium]